MNDPNLPTGMLDPGEELEMKKCPGCDGTGFDPILEDDICLICCGEKEVNKLDHDLYMSELKDDEDSNNF